MGLRFDASGNFVAVLEQREGKDLNGHGWHHGGRFEDRGGSKKDTVALSALPAAIKTYFTTNYAQDTLVRAFRNRDSSIIVLSANNGLFATAFNSTGTFIARTMLPSKHGKHNDVELSGLPAPSQSYLTATYPNFFFKHGFKIVVDGVTQGYVAFIDANGTKYAVQFDANGVFVKATTVR